jgi:hypothetical protein
MKKKFLTLAVLICFLISVANLMAADYYTAKKEPKDFKDASKLDKEIKDNILKSREYKRAYQEIKAMGRKGPAAARQRLRVYPKQAIASEITINERGPTGLLHRRIEIGSVLVDSGGSVGNEPTPIGILMVRESNEDFQALKLTAKIGKDGKPVTSLMDAKGKSAFDTQLEILNNSPMKIKPNGTLIATDRNEVLILMSRKRTGETYALVVPSEAFVKILGRTGSGSVLE